ncbi:MAG: c-type cytochrome biogenesis protein CcsB, partial [Desulfobacterales bacterium]|nr:c-type cytochrome biogenesis protein CcsB [Desulfobacterales bacterium]
MNSSNILSILTFVLGFASVLYVAAWVFKKPVLGRLASIVAVVGAIGILAGILLRWVESHQMGIGHVPLSNLYESLIFFAWTIMLLYMIVEWRTKNKTFGTFV